MGGGLKIFGMGEGPGHHGVGTVGWGVPHPPILDNPDSKTHTLTYLPSSYQAKSKLYCRPNGPTASILYRIWITKSGAMVFILNLDKVSLKKLFPMMNILKVRIFNIENRKYANVRKRPCTGLWKWLYMAVKSNFQQVLLKTLIPRMDTLKDIAVLNIVKTDGKCAPEAKREELIRRCFSP